MAKVSLIFAAQSNAQKFLNFIKTTAQDLLTPIKNDDSGSAATSIRDRAKLFGKMLGTKSYNYTQQLPGDKIRVELKETSQLDMLRAFISRYAKEGFQKDDLSCQSDDVAMVNTFERFVEDSFSMQVSEASDDEEDLTDTVSALPTFSERPQAPTRRTSTRMPFQPDEYVPVIIPQQTKDSAQPVPVFVESKPILPEKPVEKDATSVSVKQETEKTPEMPVVKPLTSAQPQNHEPIKEETPVISKPAVLAKETHQKTVSDAARPVSIKQEAEKAPEMPVAKPLASAQPQNPDPLKEETSVISKSAPLAKETHQKTVSEPARPVSIKQEAEKIPSLPASAPLATTPPTKPEATKEKSPGISTSDSAPVGVVKANAPKKDSTPDTASITKAQQDEVRNRLLSMGSKNANANPIAIVKGGGPAKKWQPVETVPKKAPAPTQNTPNESSGTVVDYGAVDQAAKNALKERLKAQMGAPRQTPSPTSIVARNTTPSPVDTAEKNPASTQVTAPEPEATLQTISPVTFSWQSKKTDAEEKFKELSKFSRMFGGELKAFQAERQPIPSACYLLQKATEKALGDVESNEAFVCIQDKVFYVNRDKGIRDTLSVSTTEFLQGLENKSVDRMLSNDELLSLRGDTYYLRPDDLTSFQVTLDKTPSQDDFNKAISKFFGPLGGSKASLAAIAYTKPEKDAEAMIGHFEALRSPPQKATTAAVKPAMVDLQAQLQAKKALQEGRSNEGGTAKSENAPAPK